MTNTLTYCETAIITSVRGFIAHAPKVLHSGRLLASPANIRLGGKGLPGTNTLAYYEN